MIRIQPLVYIIILSYNGKKWLDNCISSALATDYPNYKVLVIDNASSDGSADYIKKKYPQVDLIINEKNYGFAEGNNIGMRYALKKDAEYIVLLNQDTKVDPKWISEIVKVAENNNKIGILSPMQYDYDCKKLDPNFKKIINLRNNMNNDFLETTRIIGASMLITKNVCQKVGLFDPLFFCYHEETDFCRRVLYYGFKIGVAIKSKICHWHALLHLNELSPRSKYLISRNDFICHIKNPQKPLVRNLLGYLRGKLKLEIWSFGYMRGIIEFFVQFIKQIHVFFYLPLILYKRHMEKRKPCYLQKKRIFINPK